MLFLTKHKFKLIDCKKYLRDTDRRYLMNSIPKTFHIIL